MPALQAMESILEALWRASWQASMLILLVLLAQVTMRRWLSPAWRSALWLLVALRLLLPVTPPSVWSLFNLTSHFDALRAMALHPPAAVEANAHRSAGLRHGDVALADRISHVESTVSAATEIHPHDASPQTVSNDPMPGAVSTLEAPESTAWNSGRRWVPILFWIWLTGVLVLGARIVAGACLLSQRIRRHAVVSDHSTFQLLEESRRVIGTRRAPVLVETDAVDSPALFGLLRPKLLLPTGLIRRLNESELRHVFLHELAHLRRHDLLLNWLAALLQILHWFNPVVWFGFDRMRADRELACDALALTRSDGIDPAAYGTTILKLVSDLTPQRQVAGLVGMSEGKAHLKRRLRNIASHRKPTRWATATGALALFLVTGLTLTDARAIRGVSELSAEAGMTARPQVESPRQGAVAPPPIRSAPSNPAVAKIEAKLRQIVLDEVRFDGLKLPEVVDYLEAVVRQQDPEWEGIHFLIVQDSLDASGVAVAGPTDMNNVRIWVDPALRNVRLGDVLAAITRGANEPIAYSIANVGTIEECKIVFTPKPTEQGVQLETRIYKVDPARLLAGISAIGLPEAQDPELNLQEQVRDIFRDAGVNVMPPNQFYLNDRKGVLMVRATLEDLGLIENVIKALEKSAPQGSGQSQETNDGTSVRSGEARVLETRIFRINVEKLIESQGPFDPADSLLENSPRSDHIPGMPATGADLNHDWLPLPIGLEPHDESVLRLPGVTSTNLTEEIWQSHLALRRLLQFAAVSVMPPNAIYFKPRRELLMVTATTQELDNLQDALEQLEVAQRKVQLEVRTVELRRTHSKEMGLDWFIGNTEIEAKSAGVFPGGPEASSPRPADSAESPAQVRSAIPPLGQVTGILTEHQFAVVLGALEQRPDTDIKSLPSVTTASGLKTRISWTTASGIPVEVDCVPIVGADGYSVRLMLTMDLGGDADGLDTPDGAAGRASALQESNRQVVVWTGQTMVLGGLISESNSEGTDETSRQLKNVIVFITPSILDTRGNRVPLPDSFAPDTIPRQAMGSDLYY